MTPATRRAGARRFYEDALSEAEAHAMTEALEIEGFDEEIALLRLRLRTTLEERPVDLPLMLRGMDLLRRLVASRYGLKRGDNAQLAAFAEETLRRIQERGEGGTP